jgi:hypothetical protein
MPHSAPQLSSLSGQTWEWGRIQTSSALHYRAQPGAAASFDTGRFAKLHEDENPSAANSFLSPHGCDTPTRRSQNFRVGVNHSPLSGIKRKGKGLVEWLRDLRNRAGKRRAITIGKSNKTQTDEPDRVPVWWRFEVMISVVSLPVSTYKKPGTSHAAGRDLKPPIMPGPLHCTHHADFPHGLGEADQRCLETHRRLSHGLRRSEDVRVVRDVQ